MILAQFWPGSGSWPSSGESSWADLFDWAPTVCTLGYHRWSWSTVRAPSTAELPSGGGGRARGHWRRRPRRRPWCEPRAICLESATVLSSMTVMACMPSALQHLAVCPMVLRNGMQATPRRRWAVPVLPAAAAPVPPVVPVPALGAPICPAVSEQGPVRHSGHDPAGSADCHGGAWEGSQ
jgi:hypothetical protein